MEENLKKDYLKYLFHKTQTNLTRYQISNPDSELIKNIFQRLSHSENLAAELYILFNIKEFKNLSKYFIYVFKKIEEDVINFDNLLQNLHTDSEYIENEILIYLSNPMRKEISYLKFTDETHESEIDNINNKHKRSPEVKTEEIDNNEEKPVEEEAESEVIKFRENYLELIQSEEGDQEVVFDLPDSQTETDPKTPESAFDLPSVEIIEKRENESEIKFEIETTSGQSASDKEADTTHAAIPFEEKEELLSPKQEENVDIENNIGEGENTDDERIQLSEEIQEELNLFKYSEDAFEEEETAPEEEAKEPLQTNALFLEYENEIKKKNRYLETEFDRMIDVVNLKSSNDVRVKIINSIIETSNYLEIISRNMSLEIISNIYQTITLSFEKISESKYDISESTLNLFKKGLALVLGLIKGDDYYGYKDILKSIENIRNALIEEKQKRETYLRRLQEKLDLENNLNKKYPSNIQKEKISILKQIIKDTELNFKLLEKISGEYQIYEALRSLSSNLNNFKDIVKLAKELQMKKLVQLSEAGYIFVKFLQNYRINPVTIETTEIFGYIIYNLKALVVEKPVDDIDLFISYLNDPVKIFSKTENKKT